MWLHFPTQGTRAAVSAAVQNVPREWRETRRGSQPTEGSPEGHDFEAVLTDTRVPANGAKEPNKCWIAT